MKIYYIDFCDNCPDCISHIERSYCSHKDAPDESDLTEWDNIPDWCPLDELTSDKLK